MLAVMLTVVLVGVLSWQLRLRAMRLLLCCLRSRPRHARWHLELWTSLFRELRNVGRSAAALGRGIVLFLCRMG